MSNDSIYEQLVQRTLNGDKSAMNELVAEFAPIVEIIASRNVGKSQLTRNDLIQEGMIGLLGAVYGFSPDGGAGFRTYASTCIANAVTKALEKQSAKKHMPLNSYVPIEELDEASDLSTDPQAILNMQSVVSELDKLIETELSPLERNVLRLHISGKSHSAIADLLSVSGKSVDNALQRARTKLRGKWIP